VDASRSFVEVYPRPRPGLGLYLRIKAREHSELWLLLEFRWEMDTICVTYCRYDYDIV
jgi:hypothetical protein